MIFILELIVIFLASCGFTLAFYIHTTKKTGAPLVCPLEGSCEHVVHSEYGSIIGISVEVLGMIYYVCIGMLYSLFAFAPSVLPDFMSYAIVGITVTSFLFSAYLTSIQAFVLKHWCTWCLCSALICTLILILSLYISNGAVFEFFHTFFS